MKKNLTLIILSLLINNAFAQQPNMSKQQQAVFDSTMKQLNKSIDNLNAAIHRLDSMHLSDKNDIPLISVVPDTVEIENNIKNNIEKWKVEIGDNDTGKTKVKIIEEEKIVKIDSTKKKCKNIKTTWLGLDLGLNNYLNSSGSFTVPSAYSGLELNPGKSIDVNIHVVHQKVNLIRHVINIDYGLYFELNNYRFNNNSVVLVPRVNDVEFASENAALKKNKLACSYLTIPLTIDIETNLRNDKKSVSILAGGFAGVLIGSHTKQVNEEDEKLKIHDDYNLNTIQYGLTARVGYRGINVFVNYALSNMFADGVQPALNAVSAGVGLWF